MGAFYKKELQAYFATPIGYIFIAIFLALSGALFSLLALQPLKTADTQNYFNFLLYAYAVILPLLTMRSFADERRLHTEQLFMTSPVRLSSVVFAKFLAAYTMFSATFLVSCLNLLLLYKYAPEGAPPETGVLVGNIIAILLIGAAFIAVGVFVSSLTESQLIAAFGTIAILIVFLLASAGNSYINSSFIRTVLNWISIFSRYQVFLYGQFYIPSVIYYISVAFVFLFLTVRVYEKRRWD